MSSFRITVTKIDPAPAQLTCTSASSSIETEVYRQTVEDFNIQKFARELNKPQRVRKSKTAKPTP